VTVEIDGLPLHAPGRKAGEIVLTGLPFQGMFRVEKKGLVTDVDELLGLTHMLAGSQVLDD
jgi:hypothetical protein